MLNIFLDKFSGNTDDQKPKLLFRKQVKFQTCSMMIIAE